MRSKILSAMAAVALISGPTAVLAQTAPEPATERLSEADGSALGSDETLGAIFGLVTIALLIWLLGDDEDLTPLSP